MGSLVIAVEKKRIASLITVFDSYTLVHTLLLLLLSWYRDLGLCHRIEVCIIVLVFTVFLFPSVWTAHSNSIFVWYRWAISVDEGQDWVCNNRFAFCRSNFFAISKQNNSNNSSMKVFFSSWIEKNTPFFHSQNDRADRKTLFTVRIDSHD